jgi:hypothetical protein
LIKIALEIVSKRSLKHLRKQISYQVPRVGLVLGSTSAIFYLLMCAHHRGYLFKNKKERATFIAAAISAIPILGLAKNE